MTSISSAPSTTYTSPVVGATVATPAGDAALSGKESSEAPALALASTLAPETAGALIQMQAAPPPPSPSLDLSGKDLRAVDLTKLDLRGANLKDANLSGMTLDGLDLSGADLSGANLSGSSIVGTNLSKVTAEQANFSNATIVAPAFNGGDFTSANFSGAYIGKYAQSAEVNHQEGGIHIEDAKFDNANLSNSNLKQTWFMNSSMESIIRVPGRPRARRGMRALTRHPAKCGSNACNRYVVNEMQPVQKSRFHELFKCNH